MSADTLPEAAACSWAAPWPAFANEMARLRKHVEAARPVWWRRPPFRAAPFTETEPKWHVFAGRTRDDDPAQRWTFTWHALCGFSNEHNDIFGESREFRVAPPLKAQRCSKCDAALGRIRAAARAAQS